MKPLKPENQDPVFAQIEDTWEPLPEHLQVRLGEIPASVSFARRHSYERIIHILNSILVLWSLGLLLTFRNTLFPWIERLTSSFIEVGVFSNQVFTHPLFIFLILGGLGVGWLKLELGDA